MHFKKRTPNDVTSWLVKNWQICAGNVQHKNINENEYISSSEENLKLTVELINKSNKKIICLNDNEHTSNFYKVKEELKIQLLKKFPRKSLFEK